MKRILILFTVLLLLAPTVLAQEDETLTPTITAEDSSENDSELDNTIKSLKEKIEDKVEEINKSSKRVIKGVISSVKEEIIEVETDTGEIYTVTLDDTISKYFSSSIFDKEEIEQEDLKEGDLIIVSGPIIEDQVSANIIYQQTEYEVLRGTITMTDSNNYVIGVVTPEKDEYTLDIESDTIQNLMNSQTLEIENAGFSKYKVGDSLHFVIEKADEDNRASAVRTLIIPQEYFVDEEQESDIEPTEIPE